MKSLIAGLALLGAVMSSATAEAGCYHRHHGVHRAYYAQHRIRHRYQAVHETVVVHEEVLILEHRYMPDYGYDTSQSYYAPSDQIYPYAPSRPVYASSPWGCGC